MRRIRASGSRPSLAALGALVSFLICVPLHAQQPPDAGSLLREQPKPPALRPAPPAITTPDVPAASDQETGPRILVKGFRIQGATLIPEDELIAQLKGAIGREMRLGQIRGHVRILIAYYLNKGYLARVLLPPQEIKDGIITLTIIEGVRGSLRIDNRGERVNADRVARMIDRRVGANDKLNLTVLGEALTLLNEQPGVIAQSTLARGKGEGDIDVIVTAADRRLATYSLGANNEGSRGTDVFQANAGIVLNNPSGAFDAASLFANASHGSTFGRAEYSLAVGDAGLRLGVNGSQLDYRIMQSSFAALQLRGTASTLGLSASYRRLHNQRAGKSPVHRQFLDPTRQRRFLPGHPDHHQQRRRAARHFLGAVRQLRAGIQHRRQQRRQLCAPGHTRQPIHGNFRRPRTQDQRPHHRQPHVGVPESSRAVRPRRPWQHQ